MNTKLIAGIGLMLILTSTGMAYSGSREVVMPGTANVPGVITLGLATCERVSDAVTTLSPIFCETTGFSAFFADIGDCTVAGCVPATDTFAEGNCAVTKTAASTQVLPLSGAGDYFFSCGTDRDDDTFVTNGDAQPAGDGDAGNAEPDGYDDEWVDGDNVNNSQPYCFTRDVSSPDDSPGPSTNPNTGSGDWDDVVVFVGANVGSTTSYVGTLTVTLTASGSGTAGCTNLGARSAHTDMEYHFDSVWPPV